MRSPVIVLLNFLKTRKWLLFYNGLKLSFFSSCDFVLASEVFVFTVSERRTEVPDIRATVGT